MKSVCSNLNKKTWSLGKNCAVPSNWYNGEIYKDNQFNTNWFPYDIVDDKLWGFSNFLNKSQKYNMRLLFTGKFPTNSIEYNLCRDARFFLQAPPTYLLSPVKGKGLLMSIQDYYMTGGVQEISMSHVLRQGILDVPSTLCGSSLFSLLHPSHLLV